MADAGPVAGALLNLVVGHEGNQMALVHAGAVEPLTAVLAGGAPGAQLAAARTLGKLAGAKEAHAAVGDRTTVAALVVGARTGAHAVREACAAAIGALAAESAEGQLVCAECGGDPSVGGAAEGWLGEREGDGESGAV